MESNEIFTQAESITSFLKSVRKVLHENPEIGFEIDKTFVFVKEKLEEFGCEVKRCGKAGLVTTIGDVSKGRTILLRADMDAVPMDEKAVHACGHDMHTTMLLGAVKILKTRESELEGAVKFMFQPAEEILAGAKDMIENGVLENPRIDAAFMLHVMTGVDMPTGMAVVSSSGVSAPAATHFKIQVKGKAGHGSSPEQGIDTILPAAQMVISLQEILSKEVERTQYAVLSVGSFHGGEASNVIADETIIKGSIRTFDDDTMEYIKTRMTEIVESTAKTFRAQGKVVYERSCPVLVNDVEMSTSVERYIQELLGIEKVCNSRSFARKKDGKRSSVQAGSEDFSYVSKEVPSVMVALAAGNMREGFSYPLHHKEVKFDEEVLPVGSAIYAYVAWKWIKEKKELRGDNEI